jgi:hypothetical protein
MTGCPENSISHSMLCNIVHIESALRRKPESLVVLNPLKIVPGIFFLISRFTEFYIFLILSFLTRLFSPSYFCVLSPFFSPYFVYYAP